ncbi:hypothetical protein AX16_004725 [Volvariella volvacea WC 439]|nr:hypothetical protein AX16_004725 [Volvariella volvacea WC 439]
MFKLSALSALVCTLPLLVQAQQPLYAQCGGINWTGGTTCVAGAVCTVLNEWYHQCLPGSSTPTSSSSSTPTSSTPTSSIPNPTSTPSGNPYTGHEIYLSPYYADEVRAAAAVIADPVQKAKALRVAEIPTFIWFDVVAKTPTLATYLAEADALQRSTGKKYIVQIVVYDLPDRDCAAAASNGEFQIINNGLNLYKNYIDRLVTEIKKYPNVRIVAVIEPDSLANLVTNLNVPKCQGAQTAYKEGVIYAVRQLNSVGVYMYLDAGHAGWLGWPANLTPAAQLFGQLYRDAGSPTFLRGLATNVANYNALRASTPDPVTSPNPNYDEQHFIDAFAPALRSNGFPAQFIVDQGRSGVQNIRSAWGNWCNIRGAGFGLRPSTNTGSSLIDSIVWIKPGGECDGTSNTSAPRYDPMCGNANAFTPAPEAGTWFQEYFEMLVRNANPAL